MRRFATAGGVDMTEGLEKLCGKISLVGGEAKGISITEGEIAKGKDIGERFLVGKI